METSLFFLCCIALPFAGYMAGRQVRRWVRMGNPLWGWLSGLGGLAWLIMAVQLYTARQQRASFERIGLCPICYEYSGFAFLLLWSAALIGLIVFLATALRSYAGLNRERLRVPFPNHAWKWLTGALLLIGLWFATPRFEAILQQARLVDSLANSTPVIGPQAGYMALPLSLGQEFMGSSSYVPPGGIYLSPDGRWLIVSILNRDSGKPLIELRRLPGLELAFSQVISGHYSVSIAFNRSSDRLALVDANHVWLYRLSRESPQQLWETQVADIYNSTIQFIDQNQRLLILSNPRIIVLDASSGKELERWRLPGEGPYYFPVLDPFGRQVAWRTVDSIYIIDWRSGEQVKRLHTQKVSEAGAGSMPSLYYLPDGRLLVLSYLEEHATRPLAVWDIHLNQQQLLSIEYPYSIQPLTFSPDARWMAVAQTNKIILYDTNSWQTRVSYQLPAAITALGFSQDGRYLVVASADSRLRWFVP